MLKEHPRKKSDAQLRAIAEAGGFVGFASYTPFLPKGEDSTLDDCVAAIGYLERDRFRRKHIRHF